MSDSNGFKDNDSRWDSASRPLAVALLAPKDCGKTAYVAALRHIATRASHRVDGVGFRLDGLRGFGLGEQQATIHIECMYQNMLNGDIGDATSSWYMYRTMVERREGGRREQREVFLLDAMGGHLFPGRGVDPLADDPGRDSTTLAMRIKEANLDDAEHVLMAFVNEPTPVDEWRLRGDVPVTVANYLAGMEFDRVVLYVACSDVLFPRQGDLRGMLDRYNRDAESITAFRRYVDHFRGSPHCDFTLDLVRYLADAGLARQDGNGATDLAVFWGSSFGVSRSSGQSNVKREIGPSRIRDPEDWLPVQVMEPILWSAGFLGARGGV